MAEYINSAPVPSWASKFERFDRLLISRFVDVPPRPCNLFLEASRKASRHLKPMAGHEPMLIQFHYIQYVKTFGAAQLKQPLGYFLYFFHPGKAPGSMLFLDLDTKQHMFQGSERPRPKKNIFCSGEPKKFIDLQPLGCRILALGWGKSRMNRL